MEKGAKKRSRIVPFIFVAALICVLSLYILDEYVFPEKPGVYFTEEPSLRQRVLARINKDKEQDESIPEKPSKPENKKDVEPKEPPIEKPAKPKIKTVQEMASILQVSYPEWIMNEWEYNVRNSRIPKLKKNIYGKDEIREWDIEMHGEANLSRMKKGVEEFYKKSEQESKDAQREGADKETEPAERTERKDGLNERMGEGSEPAQTQKPQQSPSDDKKDDVPPRKRLDHNSYKLIRFMPGPAQDGYFLDYSDLDYVSAVSGDPAFSMTGHSDLIRIDDHRQKFLSLGNGGSLVYEVVGGELIDGDGPDFVIYADSAFSKGIKTARVEVAQRDIPGEYVDFTCNSVTQPYALCAGVHPYDIGKTDPVLRGGDAYDLAKIGVERARYIRITDTSDNFNEVPLTDGFNIDSISLIHAYEPLKPR